MKCNLAFAQHHSVGKFMFLNNMIGLIVRIFFPNNQSCQKLVFFMSGLSTGFWNDLEEIKALYSSDRTFAPQMILEENEKLYAGWKKAVDRTRM